MLELIKMPLRVATLAIAVMIFCLVFFNIIGAIVSLFLGLDIFYLRYGSTAAGFTFAVLLYVVFAREAMKR